MVLIHGFLILGPVFCCSWPGVSLALLCVQELVPEDLLLDIGLPLGIALAAERKKGDQSEFWSHLRLLPAEPQAPWYKTPEEQSAICDKLGESHKQALATPSRLLARCCGACVSAQRVQLIWGTLPGTLRQSSPEF